MRTNTKQDYTCEACGKMYVNIKQHLERGHRRISDVTMHRPTKKDSVETYKKYYLEGAEMYKKYKSIIIITNDKKQ